MSKRADIRQVSHEEMRQIIQSRYDALLIEYARLQLEIERAERKLAEYRKTLDHYSLEDQQKS